MQPFLVPRQSTASRRGIRQLMFNPETGQHHLEARVLLDRSSQWGASGSGNLVDLPISPGHDHKLIWQRSSSATIQDRRTDRARAPRFRKMPDVHVSDSTNRASESRFYLVVRVAAVSTFVTQNEEWRPSAPHGPTFRPPEGHNRCVAACISLHVHVIAPAGNGNDPTEFQSRTTEF